MKPWQHWDYRIMFSVRVLIQIVLAVRYRTTPFHLIYSNPTLPYGGMEIGSKQECMVPFKGAEAYLEQVLIQKDLDQKSKLETAKEFLKFNTFPIIAKPDLGSVARGVRTIHNFKQLETLLSQIPVDYMLQEFTKYKHEYGVFFCKIPGEQKGRVISLTEKIIPAVTGDGKSTVRELLEREPRYKYSRSAILKYSMVLDKIPEQGKLQEMIEVGSLPFGALYRDRGGLICDELHDWVNNLLESQPEFHYGRFDMKMKDPSSLKSGKNVKIIELNGFMSEQIQIYDLKHSLFFGISQAFKCCNRAYKIAGLNKKRHKLKIPYRKMLMAIKVAFHNEKSLYAISEKKL